MGFSEDIKKAATDEWYTQPHDVERIIPFLHGGGYEQLLCPFDTSKSAFVTVLTANGFNVTNSHIDTGTDFFNIDNLSSYDAVVSNPPFSKRQQILERLFEAKMPFAMIMNFNGLFDAKSRWRLFRDNEFELLVPQGRMKFFNENGVGNSPNFQSVWVCHGMADKQIVFID